MKEKAGYVHECFFIDHNSRNVAVIEGLEKNEHSFYLKMASREVKESFFCCLICQFRKFLLFENKFYFANGTFTNTVFENPNSPFNWK